MKTFCFAALALSMAAGSLGAQAQIIAINFQGNQGTNGSVNARTGVVAADSVDWTNFGGTSGTGSNLKETTGAVGDTGTATTVGLTYSAEDPYYTADANLGKLFIGYLDGNGASAKPSPLANGTVSVTLTNIPFALYNVYAYIAPSTNHSSSFASIGSETLTFKTDNPTGTTFTVNSDPAADHPQVNTLLFQNVSGSSFTFLENGNNNNTSVGLSGIEIVQVVPEPGVTSLMLLGLAVGVVVLHRRRRMA
jgi:hypothetical protein